MALVARAEGARVRGRTRHACSSIQGWSFMMRWKKLSMRVTGLAQREYTCHVFEYTCHVAC